MNEETKVPDIRFECFDDNWEELLLGDVVELIDGDRGVNYPKSTDFLKSGHTLFLSAENIKTTGFSDLNKQFITQIRSDLLGNGEVLLDDIIITSRGTVGNVVHMDEDILKFYPHIRINSGMLIIRNFEKTRNDTLFIEKYLKSPKGQNQINSLVFGSAQPQLTKKDVLRFKLPLPTIDEQIKIGKLIELIETKVDATRKEIAELSKFKQAMLQKMFPKEGETVPEVRFEEFEGEWRNTTLSEVAEIHGGGTPSTSIPEYWNGDIDWYAPAEINGQNFVSKSQKTITEFGLQKSSTKILPIGTVLFTSRAGIGKTAILAKEGTTNQGFQSIVPNKNQLDSYFIYARTDELKRYGEEKGAGSTFVEVSGKQMAKMPIRIPLLKEQKKIGEYFKALDNNIQSKQSELDKLKQFKQAMLDKMFV